MKSLKKFLPVILLVFIVLLGTTGCISPRVSELSFSKVPTIFEYRPTNPRIDGFICEVDDYTEIEELFIMELTDKGLSSYQMYDASELTAEILENRNGITIIERCVGFVEDSVKGDGVVLNAFDHQYNYISYRSCGQEVRDGTILVSYMVYNPDTTYIDDITERYDFVICRDYECEVFAV